MSKLIVYYQTASGQARFLARPFWVKNHNKYYLFTDIWSKINGIPRID